MDAFDEVCRVIENSALLNKDARERHAKQGLPVVTKHNGVIADLYIDGTIKPFQKYIKSRNEISF